MNQMSYITRGIEMSPRVNAQVEIPFAKKPLLYKVEWTLYLVAWCSGVLYALYQTCVSGIDNFQHLSSEDFEDGWTFLGRPKDVSDYEWAVFSELILSYVPLTVCHVAASNLIKQTVPKILPYFYVAFSFAAVIHSIGLSAAFFLVFQIVLMYYVHLVKSKKLCWGISILFLAFLNHETGTLVKDYMVVSDSREEYLLSVTISWIICRCLSFCMVQCGTHEDSKENIQAPADGHNIVLMLSYCLYFPLLFSGPLYMYDDFKRDLSQPPLQWPPKRISRSIFSIVRFGFWFAFFEFTLHFAYFSALNYQATLVEQLPLWSLCGLGYGMCQMFMVKYTVLYGLSSTVANMEGIAVDSKPKCIARIHLYSDMWKYIYVPVIGEKPSGPRKLCAGALCFVFVYVWHGTSERILLWSALNFVALAIENFGFYLGATKTAQQFKNRHLSPFVCLRLRALLIAVLLMMSSISNFCFICGLDVARTVVQRIVLWGWSGPVFVVLAFLYAMCHVSEEIRLWEFRKKS